MSITLTTWRDEIGQELAQVRAALLAAQTEFVTASEAASVARHELAELTNAIGKIDPAAAIHQRLNAHQAHVRNAIGAAARAEANVAALRERIVDLGHAVEQLDRLIPQPETEIAA